MSTDLADAMLRAVAAQPATTWHASVTAVNAADATVDITLLGAHIDDVPYLGGPYWIGDTVLLSWRASQVMAVSRVGTVQTATTPPGSTTPPPPSPLVRLPIEPASRGTYRNGSWLSDTAIRQGNWGWGNNYGAAFYGDAIVALNADPAAMDRAAALNVTRTSGGIYAPAAPTFRLLAEKTRPAGAPTVIEQLPGPALAIGAPATWPLPVAWWDALCAGTAGGIGVGDPDGEPYIVFADQPAQFTLSAAYRPQGG